MPDFLVRWADFSGGDFGTLDPGFAEKDQYSGQNIQRYNTGLLGPRAGLKTFTVDWAGAAGTHPVLGPYGFDAKDDKIIINLGNKTYRIPIDTKVANDFNIYGSTPTGFVRYAQGDRSLYALINGDLYKHNEGTDVVTQISLPGGIKLSHLVRWGYYLVGVQTTEPYRLWHSTVTLSGPDFDTWGANNYIDVGSNLPIQALCPVYNTLYCGKADGWWGVSGVLGTEAAVRMRNMGQGVYDQRQATVTTDNRVLYWGKDTVPLWFNGDRVRPDRDFQLSGFATSFAGDTVVATPTGSRAIMLGERSGKAGMLVFEAGKWSTHLFDIPISAIAGSDVRNSHELPDGVVFMCQRPTNIGDPVSIVSFATEMNRPAHTNDTWAAPKDAGSADLVTGVLDLPAFWDGQGRYLRVTAVIVQFRKWPNGIADTRNEIQCRVKPFGMYDAGSMNTEIKLWTESSDRADTNGTDDSIRFSFGENPMSTGFQVQFPVLRGVAIRNVIAECEVRTSRG